MFEKLFVPNVENYTLDNKNNWLRIGQMFNWYGTPHMIHEITEDPFDASSLYVKALATYDDGPQASYGFIVFLKNGDLLIEDC